MNKCFGMFYTFLEMVSHEENFYNDFNGFLIQILSILLQYLFITV